MSSLDRLFKAAVESQSRVNGEVFGVKSPDELPDTILPEYEKAELRKIIDAFENDHSEHALAYLSNGLWAAAERKREKGRCRCEMPHGFGTCGLCGKPVYENR